MKFYMRLSLMVCLGFFGGLSQASKPSMEKVTPPIGTRGSDFTVAVIGSGLSEVKNAVFYDPGLSCQSIEAIQDDEIRLKISADSTCKLGSYPFRLIGPNGVSEMRSITLTPFPILSEGEASKQLPDGNRTILGTLEGDAIDTFEIELRQGETFSAEVHAMRLGAGFLDTKLELVDTDGTSIVTSDDSPLTQQDPSFSIYVPKSGRYRLSITSVDGRADADSPYALHIGSFPRPYGIFPIGIAVGSEQPIAAIHDDPKLNTQFSISTVNANTGTRTFEITENGISCPSPIPLRVFDGAIVHMNDKTRPSESSEIIAPCSIQGAIREKGQTDEITFVARKSGPHRSEVFASRVGSKLDSVIELRDSDGSLIATGDDFEGLDAKIDFHAEEGEQYRLSISDKRGNGSFNNPYCLEVAPIQPAVTAFLPRRDKRSQARQVIEVPSGNRVLAYFGIRKEGTNAPVSIGLTNLPSSLRVVAGTEQPDTFVIPVVIESSASGEEFVSFAGVMNTLSGEPIAFQQVVDLIHGPADTLFNAATTDRVVVATTPSNPFRVDIDPQTVPLATDGTLGLKVRVSRTEEFDLPIDLKLSYLPEWIEAVEKVTVPADQSETVISLRSFELAQPREWPIVVEASAGIPVKATEEDGNERRSRRRTRTPLDYGTVASSLQTLRIIETPCTGNISPISAEQSQTVSVQCHVKLGDGVPDRLIATLEGLPNRVTAEPVEVDKDASSVTFDLIMASDAPLGTFPDVYCRLSGEINGTYVSYCLARRTKLVISKAGESMKDENGNPLSPLDALRRKSSITSNKPNTNP
jgi:hypothetical protein